MSGSGPLVFPLLRTVALARSLAHLTIVTRYGYGRYCIPILDKTTGLVYISWPFYIVPHSVLLYLRTTQSPLYYVELAQRQHSYLILNLLSLSHLLIAARAAHCVLCNVLDNPGNRPGKTHRFYAFQGSSCSHFMRGMFTEVANGCRTWSGVLVSPQREDTDWAVIANPDYDCDDPQTTEYLEVPITNERQIESIVFTAKDEDLVMIKEAPSERERNEYWHAFSTLR